MPGGAIGVLIDHATGYGYNYPITMRIVMGDTIRLDEKPATTKTTVAVSSTSTMSMDAIGK